MSAQPVPQQPPLIRVTEAREVLAYVPHAMGFQPESSLVAISLRPPRGRIGLVARVDLGDVTGVQGDAVAHGLVRHLAADGASGVFLVVYVPGPLALARRSTLVRAAVDAVERAATVPVRDAWVVAADGFAALRCDDVRCCPEAGHPLSELGTTQINTAMVVAGSAPVARRRDLRAGEETDPGMLTAFEAAARAESGRRARARRDGREERWRAAAVRDAVGTLTDARRRAPGAFSAGGTSPADPVALGRLAEAVRDIQVRDAVIAGLLTSSAVEGEVELLGALDAMFLPGAPAPDRDRTGTARTVLADGVRLARGRTRSRLLGVLAWVSWWCGDGATAQVMAQEALDLHGSDRLALLVEQALEAGLAPAWVVDARSGGA